MGFKSGLNQLIHNSLMACSLPVEQKPQRAPSSRGTSINQLYVDSIYRGLLTTNELKEKRETQVDVIIPGKTEALEKATQVQDLLTKAILR